MISKIYNNSGVQIKGKQDDGMSSARPSLDKSETEPFGKTALADAILGRQGVIYAVAFASFNCQRSSAESVVHWLVVPYP
jgi:hypothetical protein